MSLFFRIKRILNHFLTQCPVSRRWMNLPQYSSCGSQGGLQNIEFPPLSYTLGLNQSKDPHFPLGSLKSNEILHRIKLLVLRSRNTFSTQYCFLGQVKSIKTPETNPDISFHHFVLKYHKYVGRYLYHFLVVPSMIPKLLQLDPMQLIFLLDHTWSQHHH